MSRKNVHTVHNEKGWTNRYENSNRTLGYYDTKAKAQEAGREKEIKNGSEHIIHGLNGRIQNKNSYGGDPCPPRDKE